MVNEKEIESILEDSTEDFSSLLPKEEELEKKPGAEVSILSLDSLKKSGGLLDRKPVKKRIEWVNSEDESSVEFDVWVRRQSFKTFSVFIEDREKIKDKSATALMISKCIARDNNGLFDLLTYEQACDLDYTLALALANAIHEVNSKKK